MCQASMSNDMEPILAKGPSNLAKNELGLYGKSNRLLSGNAMVCHT